VTTGAVGQTGRSIYRSGQVQYCTADGGGGVDSSGVCTAGGQYKKLQMKYLPISIHLAYSYI
jgi:hypothetical protein